MQSCGHVVICPAVAACEPTANANWAWEQQQFPKIYIPTSPWNSRASYGRESDPN